MIRSVFLIACCFALAKSAPNGTENEDNASEDNIKCVDEFVQWCKGMNYTDDSSSISLVSVRYHDGFTHYRVFCSSDSNGTNCIRNGKAWFNCSPEGNLTYDGQMLQEGSAEGVNDTICNETNAALNILGFQSNQTEQQIIFNDYRQSVEDFFNDLYDFQQQMREIQSQIFGDNPWFFFLLRPLDKL
uniref:U38-Austrotoxin-Ht1a_1 n=1 Tax=Hickmania troglodytes TaxID=489260 RepID=A0A482ZCJ8_9ARAC